MRPRTATAVHAASLLVMAAAVLGTSTIPPSMPTGACTLSRAHIPSTSDWPQIPPPQRTRPASQTLLSLRLRTSSSTPHNRLRAAIAPRPLTYDLVNSVDEYS